MPPPPPETIGNYPPPALSETTIYGTDLMVPVGGSEIQVVIPYELRPKARRQLVRLARSSQRRAAIAANQATMAYTMGAALAEPWRREASSLLPLLRDPSG